MTLTVGLGADARQAQVFVACLPYSGYLYAEATWTQQLEEWLASHVRLFEHLGGVPAKLVPDNLKVGVSHASFYDPAINPAFQDLARHYRTAVLPARVRRPRDKASAENGVQQIERRVLAPLRDVIFATLDAANTALRAKLAEFNAAPVGRRPHHSRASLFATEEQPTLRPLPPDRFVPGTWARYKVSPDYHLALDGGVYSVPYTLIGKTVDVHSTASVISVFLRGKRMACHARRQDGATVTLEAHRPANHRAVARYTPDHIHAALAEMSAAAALLFERILAGVDHPEQAVRAGLGLIRLAAIHGAGRLEQACQAALEANVGSYRYVQRWLAAPPTAPADPRRRARQPAGTFLLSLTGETKMKHVNHERLRQMRLYGMAKGLEDLERLPDRGQLTLDEQLGMLIEREAAERANTALASRLKRARLRQTACLEDLDLRTPRGLDRGVVRELASARWVREHRPVLITGPTGIGKTWLACALGNQAAREGYSVLYTRLTRLLDDWATARLDGSLARLLRRIARLDLLIVDDWAMTELTAAQRLDLMEVIDDRHDRAATMLATQVPVTNWHRLIGDATYADAILDRLVHRAYRIDLHGESMRRARADATTEIPEA